MQKLVGLRWPTFAASYQVLYSYWFSKDQAHWAPLPRVERQKPVVLWSLVPSRSYHPLCRSPPLSWFGRRCCGCRAGAEQIRTIAEPGESTLLRTYVSTGKGLAGHTGIKLSIRSLQTRRWC